MALAMRSTEPAPTTAAATGTTDTTAATDTPAATATPQEWQQPPWDFVVVPVLGLNVDEGIGGGLVFALHRYDGEGAVFRDDFALRVFLTSRLMQRHEIKWEGVDVFDLPLRAWVRLGFYSTVTQNFCGTGNAVRCDPARAEDAADDCADGRHTRGRHAGGRGAWRGRDGQPAQRGRAGHDIIIMIDHNYDTYKDADRHAGG